MSQEIDKRSARKYWWIIMILPIGLIVGTVTSLVQHLRKDQIESEQKQFQVAVGLNLPDLRSAMQNALDLGYRDSQTAQGRQNITTASRFIQGAVSPGGTGLQFKKTRSNAIDGKILYFNHADIKGTEENKITAVAIQLEGENTKGSLAKLALAPSLIRSLLDSEPTNTIRFVLVPQTTPLSTLKTQINRSLLSEDETLSSLIVIKEKPETTTADSNSWTLLDNSPIPDNKNLTAQITHPALHQSPTGESISENHLKATLQATAQLKTLILNLAR